MAFERWDLQPGHLARVVVAAHEQCSLGVELGSEAVRCIGVERAALLFEGDAHELQGTSAAVEMRAALREATDKASA